MKENIGNRNTKAAIIVIILIAITLTFTIIQFVQVCKIGNKINELKERQKDFEQLLAKFDRALK